MSCPAPRSLAHDRNFRLLWLAQSVSLVGMQVGSLALPLVAVLLLEASAAQVALLATVAAVPWLLGGLLVGVVVDRVRRRPVLIGAHVLRAAAVLTIPIAAATGLLSMLQLYVVAAVVGVASMFFEAGYHAFLPAVVSRLRLAEGNAKVAVTEAIARAAGPSVGGVLVQVAGGPVALLVQVAGYLAAAVSTAAIRVTERRPTPQQLRPVAEVIDGLRFVWQAPVVRALALTETAYLFCFNAMFAVAVVFYVRTLGLSPSVIGLVYASGSLGGLVGAILSPRFVRAWRPGRVLVWSSLVRGCGLLAIPLAAVAGPMALPCLVLGRLANAGGWSCFEVEQLTLQQIAAPDRLRGRVTGSILFASRSAESLGSFLAAILAGLIPISGLLVGGSVGALLATLLLLPLVGTRDLQQPDQDH